MNMKRIGKIILITILVCVAVLCVKNQYTSVLMQNATYGMPALIKKGSVDNLYIGSSMFRQGLDIYTLNENDESNYILAYNGNQPVQEYRQLNYLLEHGVKVKNLYVDMYIYSAWNIPEISDEKIFLEVDLKEKWNLWKMIGEQEKTTVTDFWRMFVSSNNELLLTWPINYPILNSQFYLGGSKTQTSGSDYNNLMLSKAPNIDKDMNIVQKEHIEKIIDLCESNGINLVFVETPKFKVVAEDIMYLSAMKQYAELLADKNAAMILEQSTYNYLLNQENSDYLSDIDYYQFDADNADYYMDLIHLSSEGRRMFSKKLIENF